MTDSDTLTRPFEAPVAQDDITRTHIVNCPDDKESTAAWVTEARVFGLEVEALCGYRWIPQKDPERYPLCSACVDAANIIIADVDSGGTP